MNIDLSNLITAEQKSATERADAIAAALREVRALRASFFAILAGIQSEALTNGDQPLALAVSAVQRGAKDITLLDLSAYNMKSEIDAAFYAAWMALVAAAPAAVITAFKSVKS